MLARLCIATAKTDLSMKISLKLFRLIFTIFVMVLTCVSQAGADSIEPADKITLRNSKIIAELNHHGLIRIHDVEMDKSVEFQDDESAINIDGEQIDTAQLQPSAIKQETGAVSYSYIIGSRHITVIYELKQGWRFIGKKLTISCEGKDEFRIGSVEVFRAKLINQVANELLIHRGSQGALLRLDESNNSGYGIFLLIQNPFMNWVFNDQKISMSYQADMEWKASYGTFESDMACIGPYKLTGTKFPIRPVPEWQYTTNPPTTNNTIDIAEIEAMQDCVRKFLTFQTTKSIRIDVGWCNNDYQIDVGTPEGISEYKRIIDRAADLGCQYVLYAPRNSQVSNHSENHDAWGWEELLWLSLGQKIRKGEWDPATDQVPSSVQQMLDYAKTKNVKLVAYVYPTLDYKQNPEWTKWAGDHVGGYIGVDTGLRSFQDWFIDKLVEFHNKTGIGGYSFDHWWIGYDNASSKYAQWYGCRRILNELRKRVPDIVIDGRQQYQWFGPWTWVAGNYPHPTTTDEQPGSFRAFPDLHTDRVSADRQRYAAWIYRMEYFCPPEVTPGYITHQTQRNDLRGVRRYDTFRARDWDYLGWRYSLISSIATAPFNHVVNMIPARDIFEFNAFSDADKRWFRNWLDWTDKNIEILRHLRPIIGPPMVGRVDGTAAIVGNHGFVFLFNPNYRQLNAEFILDASIGLTSGSQFAIKELYPENGKLIGKPGNAWWKLGDKISMPMDGTSAVVLEINPAPQVSAPILLNAIGKASLRNDRLSLTEVQGEVGTTVELQIVIPPKRSVRHLTVNGKIFGFTKHGDIISTRVRFSGTQFGRCQQVGNYDPGFSGGIAKGKFSIPKRIFTQLYNRRKAWPIPYTEDDLLATWLGSDRLLLFINIADPNPKMSVSMKINGSPVEVKKAYNGIYPNSGDQTFLGFYADISSLKPDTIYDVEVNLPNLKPGQFQGIFFDNIETEYTQEVSKAEMSSSTNKNTFTMQGSNFDVKVLNGRIVSLKNPEDNFETEYIHPGTKIGDVFIRYKLDKSDNWQELDTDKISDNVVCNLESNRSEYRVESEQSHDIAVNTSFELKDDAMFWSVEISNLTNYPVEVGDVAIPCLMAGVYSGVKSAESEKPKYFILRHSLVSGHGSFMYWMRSDSKGHYLVMIPTKDTHLEFFDTVNLDSGHHYFRPYIHSAAQSEVARQKGCIWRQPNTSLKLAPKGTKGDSRTYVFKFLWAKDLDDVRNVLFEEGKLDIYVVPGMTVPTDLSAKFAIRTKQIIKSVTAEFPESTEIKPLPSSDGNMYLYEVNFCKLGENLITINYGNNMHAYLEFFVTEPLETLIKKRAAFIARCQHRDESKWYNGLLSEWNMESHVMLSPDNYDRIKGWRIYAVTCDDPGLSKPAYLATKNVEYPAQSEVESLDYYIEHFVWGGLQCTDKEPYPYAIYGIPDWKTNRESADSGAKGKLHIWRIYDYPHVVLIYLSMYKIAKLYPHIQTYLSADEYLKRAYGTAMALFTVPKKIIGWSAYETGLYNELVTEDLIKELFEAGYIEQGNSLRDHWEKKVKTFVVEKPDLFQSEYPFDSTGFESTHALARYAINNSTRLGISNEEASQFLETQMSANIFCRGWLEAAYYLLGSDYRGGGNTSYTLSYMSQMGGWAVTDYALNYSSEPFKYLRLGYASYLSSWALVNSGTPESNYGYWYPGAENDGAAGGGFEPEPYGETWLEQPHHRGSWYYACEIDLGFCGALRTAATIFADDPIFGAFCYGGDLKKTSEGFEIIPKDGVRRRFYIILKDQKLGITVEGAQFSSSKPIVFKETLDEIRFTLEKCSPNLQSAKITVFGQKPNNYILLDSNGSVIASSKSTKDTETVIIIPMEHYSTEATFVLRFE